MKPITDCKQQEQDYRQKMSACNVSYRHKRSGPYMGLIKTLFYTMSHFRHNLYHCASDCAQRGKNLRGTLQNTDSNLQA